MKWGCRVRQSEAILCELTCIRTLSSSTRIELWRQSNNEVWCSFSFSCSDGDPEEARQQELCDLHGALQGEQISECEERLRHYAFLSRDGLHVCGQDDHPQGQAEHGQQLDGALAKTQSCPAPPTLSLSLLYPWWWVQRCTHPRCFVPTLLSVWNWGCSAGDKACDFCFCSYMSIFSFWWSEKTGGVRTGGRIKDTATPALL